MAWHPPRLCVGGVIMVGRIFVSVYLWCFLLGGSCPCSGGPVRCWSGPAVDLRDVLSPWGACDPLSEQGYSDDDGCEDGDTSDGNAKRSSDVEATVCLHWSLLYVVLQWRIYAQPVTATGRR